MGPLVQTDGASIPAPLDFAEKRFQTIVFAQHETEQERANACHTHDLATEGEKKLGGDSRSFPLDANRRQQTFEQSSIPC